MLRCPCWDWVQHLALCHSLSHCPFPLMLFPFLFCLVLPCLLWVGKCGGGLRPALLLRLCVLCHSIVGLGLCLCDRVVSLWNSGDGLCGTEWRGV